MKRRVYWLRHRLIHWIDQQTNEQLGLMALGAMLFLLGVRVYMFGWGAP